MIKTYRELICLRTFEERFHYLKIGGAVGQMTFGFDRYLNQALYQSREWRDARAKVLARDNGCDLAVPGLEIYVRPLVHHLTAITIEDVEAGSDLIFDLDNLVTTSFDTHNAIHFANESMLAQLPKERRKGDMCPWQVYSKA